MKPEIIGPLEAVRRLSRGELGRRERIVDAIQRFFHRQPVPKMKPRRPYVPIPDSHFYKPPERSMIDSWR